MSPVTRANFAQANVDGPPLGRTFRSIYFDDPFLKAEGDYSPTPEQLEQIRRYNEKSALFAHHYGAGPKLMEEFLSGTSNQGDVMSPKAKAKLSKAMKKSWKKRKVAKKPAKVPESTLEAARLHGEARMLSKISNDVQAARRLNIGGQVNPLEVGTAIHKSYAEGMALTTSLFKDDVKPAPRTKKQLEQALAASRMEEARSNRRVDELLKEDHDRDRLIRQAETALQGLRWKEQQLLDCQVAVNHARVIYQHALAQLAKV